MRSDLPALRARTIVLKVVVLAIVLALSLPAVAFAEPLDAIDATLLLQPQGSLEPLLLIAGRLPEGTALPAEIAIPVPPGTEGDVAWTGEILGGPVENDPAAEPRFEMREGVTVAVFELTQSDIGQIEIVYPAATEVIADDLRAAAFDLTAPAETGTARLAIAVPPGFEVASLPDGVLTSQAENGMVYYYTEFTDIAAGDSLAFGIEYRGTPAASGLMPAEQGGQGGEMPPFLIVIVGAILAGAVLLVLVSRTSKNTGDDTVEEAAPERFSSSATEDRSDSMHIDAVDAGGPDDDAAATTPATTPVAAGGPSAFLTPKVLLISAAVLVLAIFLVVNLGGRGGPVGVTETSGDVVSQRISTASAGSETSYSLIIPCSCPPEVEAVKMFDALRQVPGIAHAAFDTSTYVMNIQYDPDLTHTGLIEERLRVAGYLR